MAARMPPEAGESAGSVVGSIIDGDRGVADVAVVNLVGVKMSLSLSDDSMIECKAEVENCMAVEARFSTVEVVVKVRRGLY